MAYRLPWRMAQTPAVFPAPVAHFVSAITTFLADKFDFNSGAIGIGSRVARGRALVAVDASDAIGRIQPGDILVTSPTSPAYGAILPIVAALVVSEGGSSCHAVVVVRELDLPALVGYAGALASIPDRATIELDPVGATVRVVADHGRRIAHGPTRQPPAASNKEGQGSDREG